MKIPTFEEKMERIKNLSAGIMTWLCVETGEKDREVVFYVREDTKYLKKQGYRPIFQVRTQIINTETLSAFLVMIKINNDFNLLYDSWLNYSAPIEGIELIETLQKQNYLKFIFIDEFGQERKVIEMDNSIRDEINIYFENSMPKYPWIMEEFDFIKNYIYKRYPTGQTLWNAIANKTQEDIGEDESRRAGKKGSISAKEIIYF